MKHCIFCDIATHKEPAVIIYEDNLLSIFLDKRPLFPGHVLLIPKTHYETLLDLPDTLIEPYFTALKKLTQVVKEGMQSQGVFLAMNNVVSQSVPHAHFHVVPRTKGDGLKGFFWPRHTYRPGQIDEVGNLLKTKWNET